MIAAILFIIIEAVALYIYAQRQADAQYFRGYRNGYALGFHTARATPLLARDAKGKEINQKLNERRKKVM